MMAEKEDRRIRQGDYERYYNRIRAANTPGEEFDELEYLKEQYVDGQLTEESSNAVSKNSTRSRSRTPASRRPRSRTTSWVQWSVVGSR